MVKAMSVRIEAIYEGGVLRPVKPLDLTEGERVELSLVTTSEVEASRLSKAEREARDIEIINQNLDELSAEAWDALSYQLEL
jgi:predicted DNA-binding antitoxin AbrB/MazE fold protein